MVLDWMEHAHRIYDYRVEEFVAHAIDGRGKILESICGKYLQSNVGFAFLMVSVNLDPFREVRMMLRVDV